MKKFLLLKQDLMGLADVSETVKATEKINAAKISMLKRHVIQTNTYTDAIVDILAPIFPDSHPLISGLGGQHIIVVVSGDKGLVGDLYDVLLEKFADYPDAQLIIIGMRGKRIVEEERIPASKFLPFTDAFSHPEEFLFFLKEQFVSGKFRRIDLLYQKNESLVTQIPTVIPLLPVTISLQRQTSSGFPIYEGTKAAIADWLLNALIKSMFLHVLAEALLSEASRRTIEMEHAQKKVDAQISKIRLSYVKDKRAFSTQRQLESFMVHKMI